MFFYINCLRLMIMKHETMLWLIMEKSVIFTQTEIYINYYILTSTEKYEICMHCIYFSACVWWGCTRSFACTCLSVCQRMCPRLCVCVCACVHECVPDSQAGVCRHEYVCTGVCVCIYVSAFVPVCVPVWRECAGMNMCVGDVCVGMCMSVCVCESVRGHVCACGFAGLFHSQSIMWLSGPPACSLLEVNNDLDPSFQTDHAVLAAPAFKNWTPWALVPWAANSPVMSGDCPHARRVQKAEITIHHKKSTHYSRRDSPLRLSQTDNQQSGYCKPCMTLQGVLKRLIQNLLIRGIRLQLIEGSFRSFSSEE